MNPFNKHSLNLQIHTGTSTEVRKFGEEIYSVIYLSFQELPHPSVQSKEEFMVSWEKYITREGFMLLSLRDLKHGVLKGFLYGYRGQPETWWFDTVTRALSKSDINHWFSNAFEVVSVAVVPEFRGQGFGTLLLRKINEISSTRTLVLTTYRDQNPAVRLYHRKGFQDIHPGLSLSTGNKPMIIMGRDIRL